MDTSPKAVREVKAELDFTDAIKEVLTGRSITKLEWGDRSYYGFLENERLRLHKPDGKVYDWILSEADLRGTDYAII